MEEDKVYVRFDDSPRKLLELNKYISAPGAAVRFERYIDNMSGKSLMDVVDDIKSETVIHKKFLGKVTVERIREAIDKYLVIEPEPDYGAYKKIVQIGDTSININYIAVVIVNENANKNKPEYPDKLSLRMFDGHVFSWDYKRGYAQLKHDEIVYKMEHYL